MDTTVGGRYQIVRMIGAGGMGQVFEALDTTTGRTVAAKLLIANSADSLELLLRFQQEGALLSTLKHPNIVEVYGTFLEGDTSCIIMELLDGSSLATAMETEGRLSLSRIKGLTRQIASALDFAHARGIVHRDVKPENIMIVPGDRVKVMDFGIARVLSAHSSHTMTGMSVGTPLYMSPEQVEGQPVDGRTDIYSLGVVLYEMVTGKPPFEGQNPITVAFAHVHQAPASPRKLNEDIPADWEALIMRTLAKDPAERYMTAAGLGEAIARLSEPGPDTMPDVGATFVLDPATRAMLAAAPGRYGPPGVSNSDGQPPATPVREPQPAVGETFIPSARLAEPALDTPPGRDELVASSEQAGSAGAAVGVTNDRSSGRSRLMLVLIAVVLLLMVALVVAFLVLKGG